MRTGIRCCITSCQTGCLLFAMAFLAMTSLAVSAQELVRPDGLAPKISELQAASRVFRAAVERIRPALVTIESFGGVGTRPGEIGGIRQQGEGNTTGVMLTEDGWIITSTFNFVQRPTAITVITSDGERRLARFHGQDNTRKICLLKIQPDPDRAFAVPELADRADVAAGQWAVVCGVGFGDTTPAISAGIISATGRVGGRAIQTDAKISPACYGGPLVNLQGQLSGICVPMNPQSWSVSAGVEWYDSGIGFAVPVAGNEQLIERLKAGEIVNPAFAGVVIGGTGPKGGVLVGEVVEDGPASKLKISAGTVIVSFDGQPVNSASDFRALLGNFYAGDKVPIGFVLPGADQETSGTIELGTLPEMAKTQQMPGL